MRPFLAGLMMLAMTTAALAADQASTFVSKEYGVSIEAPVAKAAGAADTQIAAFFLPPSDNFAANVNVLRQQFADSLEAYDKQSQNQFKQFKLTILNRSLKGNELRYEYKGDLQGRVLHWYARTVKAGSYIYLVTATGLDSQWEQQKPALVKSVESFSVKAAAKK